MDRVSTEQGETTSAPEGRQDHRSAPAPRGFHEPFDGMGYLDGVTEEPAGRP